MRSLLAAILALALLSALPLMPARAASGLASLVADSLTIQSNSVLVASGHVEVFYQGHHLSAAKLTYDGKTNRLSIEGPIWLDDGHGNMVQARMADLSADLTEGILRSARLVLANRLQLAAGEILRSTGGRYTALRGVAASSCRVCAAGETPLWEIRAKSVIHDNLTHQIWFSGAQLRFWGIPVMYLPELRVPDPTLKRSTGFLLPSIRSTTQLGTGIEIPYFITLGQSRDLTVTPYLTMTGGRTVELRYRQAFRNGNITIQGAATHDNLLPSETARGYLQANGSFNLPEGFQLSFNLIGVSDPTYLLDYGISSDDRLLSTVDLTRTRRNTWISASVTDIQSLRPQDQNGASPKAISDFTLEHSFVPGLIGGIGGFELQTQTAYRPSGVPVDTTGSGYADGQDLARATGQIDWQRSWLLKPGIEFGTMGLFNLSDYQIRQDVVYQGNTLRAVGTGGVELRWPWTKHGRRATQTIEPVVQLAYTPRPTNMVPNEDSTLVEFDSGNLFSLDRFPGNDAVETGFRANLGVNYDAIFANGLDLGVTAGRVLRLTPQPSISGGASGSTGGFPLSSGLTGTNSDWLFEWNLSNGSGNGLQLTNRLVVSDALNLTKGEVLLDLTRAKYNLSGGYSFVTADPQEDLPAPISELDLAGGYNLTDYWKIQATSRYNVAAGQMEEAGIELTFTNECLNLDLSVSRRYTSSTSLQPSTDFGLSVDLLGFGGTGLSGMPRQCSG